MTRSDKSTLPSSAPVPAKPVKTDLTTPPDGDRADLPHERDESVGMTGGIPDPVMNQGHKDLERGLEDTSRSQETDKTYRKLKD
ncbi:MAG: hypothetical protein ABIX46_02820 [Burkholderiaceae bacterium]